MPHSYETEVYYGKIIGDKEAEEHPIKDLGKTIHKVKTKYIEGIRLRPNYDKLLNMNPRPDQLLIETEDGMMPSFEHLIELTPEKASCICYAIPTDEIPGHTYYIITLLV